MRAPLIDEAKREIETSNRVASSTKAEVNRGPTAKLSVEEWGSGTSDGATAESKSQSEGFFLPSRPVERIIRRFGRLVISSISENSMYVPEEQGRFSPIYHVSTFFHQPPHKPPDLRPAHHFHSTNLFQEHVPNVYRAILPNPSQLKVALVKTFSVGPHSPDLVLYIFDPETPVG